MKNINCVRSVVESSLQSGGFQLDTGEVSVVLHAERWLVLHYPLGFARTFVCVIQDVSSAGKSMRRIQYRRNVGDQTCTIIVAISMLGQWTVVTASVVSDNQNYCTSLSGERLQLASASLQHCRPEPVFCCFALSLSASA